MKGRRGSRKSGGCPGAQKWGAEDMKMATAGNSRILRTIRLLIAICLLSFPAYAKYGGGSGAVGSAETSTYLFVAG